jgi:hypothetical protein
MAGGRVEGRGTQGEAPAASRHVSATGRVLGILRPSPRVVEEVFGDAGELLVVASNVFIVAALPV